jgi:hypothetical protein
MAYPQYHSLVEKLAAKVITRVVTDGVSLSNAIKEAVNFAELDRQQTIHMCSMLQDYGMVYNGTDRDYFHMSEDMGKDFPNTPNGYVVYAGQKTGNMDRVFDVIAEFKKAGLTDEEIGSFNPNLGPILEAIKGIEDNYLSIVDDVRAGKPITEHSYTWETEQDPIAEEKPFAPFGIESEPQEELLQAANSKKRGNFYKLAQPVEAEVEPASPDNMKEALQSANEEEAPAEGGDLGGGEEVAADEEMVVEDAPVEGGEDLGGEEFEVGGDEGGVSATVKPSPADLQKEIDSAPKWEVENILSIQIAENYYGNMRKKLDAVVFNENIMLDPESMKKYDAVRGKIDEQIEKLKDAQKQTKKLETKENDLEEEFEVGEGGEEPAPEATAEGEVPTEELLVENPTEETIEG